MRLFIILLSIASCMQIGAQVTDSNGVLDQVEILISQNNCVKADSILQKIDESVIAHDSCEIRIRYKYLLGLAQFNQGNYERALNEFVLSLKELDSRQDWDCEKYLKTAYLISSSYFNLGKYEDSKEFINKSLIKCSSFWDACISSKMMYQLLLRIYEKLGGSPYEIEHIHNEIQLIAINIYASDPQNKDGEEIKNNFMYWYNKDPDIGSNDYLEVVSGKAAYLQFIKEFDEAIRLDEYIRRNVDDDDEIKSTIFDSLLQMYAETSYIDSIESVLPELH